MYHTLNKLILLFFIAFMVIPKGYSQSNADPGIEILMSPPSVSEGSTGILFATVGNYGNETIVGNSLRVTISVGANSEIIGIATGSDTRWNQLSLTSGSANTIVLTNSGGGFDSFNVGDILLTLRGIVMSDPDVVLGNIVYIGAQNPAICRSCASPPLNASQGNISNSNDNSTTSLAVTCYPGLEPNAGKDGAITICEGDGQPTEIELFSALTLADIGGAWTGPVAAVYTYTLTSECTLETDISIVTVTEGTAPNAGTDGAISICELDSQPTEAELYAALTDADTGGTWSGPVVGVYTYIVTNDGSCSGITDESKVTVTQGTIPNAGSDGEIFICELDSQPTEAELYAALTDADTGGTWSGPVVGVYTYIISNDGSCSGTTDESKVTVTQGTIPNAGSDGEIFICEGATQPTEAELYAALTDANSGGTWSGPVAGVYTYTVTAIGTCGTDSTAKVKVIVEQPAEPTTECYEIATFDNDNCIWIVSGIQPEVPITACYQKATFDKVKCEWYLTGTRPATPTTGFVMQPTCEKATGSFNITNYDESYNYVVSPMTGVSISGETVTAPEGTYTITAGIDVSGPHGETEDCTCLGSASITINPQVKCKPKLTVTLAQNPTLDCFVLLIDSMTREDLCIRIIDPYGKMIDEFILPYKDIIKLENRLSGSLYFIEVRQGEERVILKALRL